MFTWLKKLPGLREDLLKKSLETQLEIQNINNEVIKIDEQILMLQKQKEILLNKKPVLEKEALDAFQKVFVLENSTEITQETVINEVEIFTDKKEEMTELVNIKNEEKSEELIIKNEYKEDVLEIINKEEMEEEIVIPEVFIKKSENIEKK